MTSYCDVWWNNEEASAAVGALSKNFRAFNPEADAAIQVMAENIVLLEKFGVGSASTAKMIDQLSKSQGMSEKQLPK